MGGMSIIHWVIVLLVVVLLFGTKKLPELGSGLGQAINNFRKSLKDDSIDVSRKIEDEKKKD